jgi:hypothetical protein
VHFGSSKFPVCFRGQFWELRNFLKCLSQRDLTKILWDFTFFMFQFNPDASDTSCDDLIGQIVVARNSRDGPQQLRPNA